VALKNFLTKVEDFLLGFVDGSAGFTILSTQGICHQSIKDTIDASFNLVDIYSEGIEVLNPAKILQGNEEYNRITENKNVAYAYCNFSVYLQGFSNFGDIFTGERNGLRVNRQQEFLRFFSRVSGSMYT